MKMPATRKKTLVVGLGSALNEDDSFGLLVLAKLRAERAEFLRDTAFITAYDDLLGCIDQFSQYDQVVLIDTVLDTSELIGASGCCVLLDERQLMGWSADSPSVHQVSPLMAIKLFRQFQPDAKTLISLVALCTDKIQMQSSLSKEKWTCIIEDAAQKVLALL
jgi:hydrogenase maturation protease